MKRHRQLEGFTIVELLVAMTLAAMILASVLGVVGRLSDSRRIVMQRDDKPLWLIALHNQFRSDFANGRRFRLEPGVLTIWGHGGTHDLSSRITLRPAEIRYTINTVEEASWLVREVRLLDNPSRLVQRNLVCRGIHGIRFVDDNGQVVTAASANVSRRALTFTFDSEIPEVADTQLVIMH